MNTLLHPTYFPNLSHYIEIVQSEAISFETCDNYQKQTYRNRTEIYGANGKLALTVPVNYTQKNRQLYKDVEIANENDWQLQHLKSLQSAYSMSPFFEYYIDDLMPLFNRHYKYILDLNLDTFALINDCLQIEIPFSKTKVFEKEPEHKADLRHLVRKNQSLEGIESYQQVFTEKRGFISNLSILDLLFNEGPASEIYLKKQKQ
ncbi:MAG: WbqC family protein [Winogradskyella sp.]|uniref:WbqC family protein n=1 Tax=Winogradskyella sp. TaxID=1883156 RepID=UPI0025EAF08C|nr:WbqC family protein [Winogradskyella sp.]NRB58599.1 WbqC family protein [Winogradskyella sp.]